VTREAIRFASGVHDAQLRISDEAPYILHPLEVAVMLYNSDASDEVIAAGVLHDVIEDTATVIGEIRDHFGGHIAALVMNLTEDSLIQLGRDRKAALRAQVSRSGTEAGLIFAADKVAKARELRTLVTHDHGGDGPQRDELVDKVEHYAASLQMLEDLMPEHPLVRQLRFELEALDTYPPAGMSTHAHRVLTHGMRSEPNPRDEAA
jgi:hypothetical protein